MGADADVIARRLWDELQTGDVIVCYAKGERDGGIDVLTMRQMMTGLVQKACRQYRVIPSDAVEEQSQDEVTDNWYFYLPSIFHGPQWHCSLKQQTSWITERHTTPVAKVTLSKSTVTLGRWWMCFCQPRRYSTSDSYRGMFLFVFLVGWLAEVLGGTALASVKRHLWPCKREVMKN